MEEVCEDAMLGRGLHQVREARGAAGAHLNAEHAVDLDHSQSTSIILTIVQDVLETKRGVLRYQVSIDGVP